MKFQFNVSLDSFFSKDDLIALSRQKKHQDELLRRANESQSEGVEYFCCPECEQDFLTQHDEKFVCLFCHWEEPTQCCDRCHHAIPEWELLDVSELFEYEFSEGLANLVTNYGIHHRRVCDACFQEVKLEIEDEREEAAMQEWEEYYYDLSLPR